jgi:hypothetical protein
MTGWRVKLFCGFCVAMSVVVCGLLCLLSAESADSARHVFGDKPMPLFTRWLFASPTSVLAAPLPWVIWCVRLFVRSHLSLDAIVAFVGTLMFFLIGVVTFVGVAVALLWLPHFLAPNVVR